jgi:hypothetical protein
MYSLDAAAVHAGAQGRALPAVFVVDGAGAPPRDDGAVRGIVDRVGTAARQDAVEHLRHAHPARPPHGRALLLLAAHCRCGRPRHHHRLLLVLGGCASHGRFSSLPPLLSLLEVLRQNDRERRGPTRRIAVGRVLVDRRRRLRGAIVVVVWRILDLLLIARNLLVLLSLSVQFLLACKNRNLPNSLLISALKSQFTNKTRTEKEIVSRQAVTCGRRLWRGGWRRGSPHVAAL